MKKKMPRLCAISDTHTYHNGIIIPEGIDILLHAGDFSFRGLLQETIDFLQWYNTRPVKHKLFISGNHDGMNQEWPELFKELLKTHAPDCIYLENSGVTVEGVKIWGRAITPTFNNWYNAADPQSPKMLTSLSIIPKDIDILLTHGPARGLLDRTLDGVNAGCEDMLLELGRFTNLKAYVCGHIHESYGQQMVGNVLYVNASQLDIMYKLANKPIVFDL